MSAREAYERTVVNAATKAQLIKALMDTNTDDVVQLGDSSRC